MTYKDLSLYECKSKTQLKHILGIGGNRLLKQSHVASLISVYIDYKNGKPRLIEAPTEEIKKIQTKLKNILSKLTIADNIFSGVKGRSYPDNAKMHLGNKYVYKIDLTAFFPSTSRKYVYDFFINNLNCPSDIAEALTNLTTVDITKAKCDNYKEVSNFINLKRIKTKNHLITGAPTSQLLSYLVNKPMFDEIEELAKKFNIQITVYVDDITFSSSEKFPYAFKKSVNSIVTKYFFRLSVSKQKNYTNKHPKEITGVIIDKNGVPTLTNSIRKKVIDELQIVKENPENEKSLQRLKGLVVATRQVVPNSFPSVHKFAFEKKSQNK